MNSDFLSKLLLHLNHFRFFSPAVTSVFLISCPISFIYLIILLRLELRPFCRPDIEPILSSSNSFINQRKRSRLVVTGLRLPELSQGACSVRSLTQQITDFQRTLQHSPGRRCFGIWSNHSRNTLVTYLNSPIS